MTDDLHANVPVEQTGAPLDEARAAVVLLHGRGASAASILALGHELQRLGVAFLAPQAAGGAWYPYSFLAPRAQNEPALSNALYTVGQLVRSIKEEGIDASRIVLAGFSQGACLAAEFAARHAQRWGGVVVLSGGLIGSPNAPLDHEGDLDGTPVFLGCAEHDAHIPSTRVEESASVFRQMGADVDLRLYPTLGHTVNADEIGVFGALLDQLVPTQPPFPTR